jgi:hypothetical protein
MFVKLLTLCAWFVFTLTALAQPATAPSINKTTLSNGTILLNGTPFPMVLDAGTDSFTPQDYATVMGNKDAWGANTWWLQYSMRHMKSESAGDFSGLSNALDFFEKTGVWVNLYIRGEYRDLPSWFSKTYTDYKMLDPDGKPVGTQVCLQHEGFRRLIDQYARGIARAARNKPSLLMYSTYDEFCIRGWGCWCPRCIRKYREYLKEKYKDVGSLNQAWHTAYPSWEQIDAPRTQTFDPNYGDWQRYRLQVLHDFGKLYYTALKEEDPNHLVWIDINMDLYDYTWKRLCLWWKLTDTFDVFNEGPGSYADEAGIRTAMSRAIHDNYGKGATWHRGIEEREYTYKPELYSLLFEGGHSGLVWWYDFWKVLRTGKVWGVAEGENSATSANWSVSGELNHLAQYLGDLYVNSKPVRGKVALFVSGETDMLRSATDKQALDLENPTNLEGLTQMLRDVNIPYEAIGEDQLGQLSTFKAVMIGQFAMCAGQQTIKAFREYVRNGGLLIATNHAFSADDNGKEIANPAFGLEELWGSSGKVDDAAEDSAIVAVAGNPLQGVPAGMRFPSLGGVSRRKLGSAQVIARLADGTPAITLNRYGGGSVLFLGTNVGEAHNYGQLLSMGRYRMPRGQKLDLTRYPELVKRYDGWRNYALLMQAALKRAGVESPVAIASSDSSDLRDVARASLQEQRDSPSAPLNHLLIVTLEPTYDPAAEIASTPEHPAKAQPRILKNLTFTADIPDAAKVKAVYRIPSLGSEIGKIDAVPEKISFDVAGDKLRIQVSEISEAACFLIARSARPLVGVRTAHISTVENQPTRVTVTVDNAAGTDITGEIAFPQGFRAAPVDGNTPKFAGLRPSERYSATFDVYARGPIESNRTFRANVYYSDGVKRMAESYPVTSWTGERIAHGWLSKAEAAMTEAATTPGTPHGDLYGEALQKREFVYAAYNKGDWAETVRLARENLTLCEQLKAARLRGHNEPDPE